MKSIQKGIIASFLFLVIFSGFSATSVAASQITQMPYEAANVGTVTSETNLGSKNPVVKGKFSAAIKIIRKVFKKLPASVRNILNKFGFEKFLSILSTLNTTIENAIYKACRAVGMNHWWATLVKNALMVFL